MGSRRFEHKAVADERGRVGGLADGAAGHDRGDRGDLYRGGAADAVGGDHDARSRGLPTVVGLVEKLTVSEVAVAEVTVPTAPLLKTTVLLPGVVSKPKPAMVSVVALAARLACAARHDRRDRGHLDCGTVC